MTENTLDRRIQLTVEAPFYHVLPRAGSSPYSYKKVLHHKLTPFVKIASRSRSYV